MNKIIVISILILVSLIGAAIWFSQKTKPITGNPESNSAVSIYNLKDAEEILKKTAGKNCGYSKECVVDHAFEFQLQNGSIAVYTPYLLTLIDARSRRWEYPESSVIEDALKSNFFEISSAFDLKIPRSNKIVIPTLSRAYVKIGNIICDGSTKDVRMPIVGRCESVYSSSDEDNFAYRTTCGTGFDCYNKVHNQNVRFVYEFNDGEIISLDLDMRNVK